MKAGRWPPSLLAEEGVVEVCAVHRDVVLDALLAVDGNLVPIRPLNDADAGGQIHEIQHVAAVVGEAFDGCLVDLNGVLYPAGLDQGRIPGDGDDLLDFRDLHRQPQIDGLADGEPQTFLDQGGKTIQSGGDLVVAEGKQNTPESSSVVGDENLLEIGAGIEQGHRNPGQDTAGFVGDGSFDDAGGGLALGQNPRRRKES